MAMKRVVVEIGMGTDIRGADYTKAAVRPLRDALWHNSLNVASALGMPTDAMVVEVVIGVPKPDLVNKAEILAALPHGDCRRVTTRPRAERWRRNPRRPPFAGWRQNCASPGSAWRSPVGAGPQESAARRCR